MFTPITEGRGLQLFYFTAILTMCTAIQMVHSIHSTKQNNKKQQYVSVQLVILI